LPYVALGFAFYALGGLGSGLGRGLVLEMFTFFTFFAFEHHADTSERIAMIFFTVSFLHGVFARTVVIATVMVATVVMVSAVVMISAVMFLSATFVVFLFFAIVLLFVMFFGETSLVQTIALFNAFDQLGEFGFLFFQTFTSGRDDFFKGFFEFGDVDFGMFIGFETRFSGGTETFGFGLTDFIKFIKHPSTSSACVLLPPQDFSNFSKNFSLASFMNASILALSALPKPL